MTFPRSAAAPADTFWCLSLLCVWFSRQVDSDIVAELVRVRDSECRRWLGLNLLAMTPNSPRLRQHLLLVKAGAAHLIPARAESSPSITVLSRSCDISSASHDSVSH